VSVNVNAFKGLVLKVWSRDPQRVTLRVYKWNQMDPYGSVTLRVYKWNQMDPYGSVTLRVYKWNQMDPYGSVVLISTVLISINWYCTILLHPDWLFNG
jgi:hypothetical protein